MRRVTISVDDELADAFDTLIQQRAYVNRSEAFRDLLRHDLVQARHAEQPEGPCVATLTYLCAHQHRQLMTRLKNLQQQHHELSVAAVQAHLDHEHSIETIILRGRTDHVQAFADSVLALSGITHGHLHLVPMTQHRDHGHDHLQPALAPRRRAGRKDA